MKSVIFSLLLFAAAASDTVLWDGRFSNYT